MLAVDEETRGWLRLWPSSLLKNVSVSDRIERPLVLKSMTQARLLLAPSLVDGTPNSMWEAMAAGAVPIVSPLPTLIGLVKDEENVLFARNLYPEEIARQLVRGMSDAALVNRIAANNRGFVRQHADRSVIAARASDFYLRLMCRRVLSESQGLSA
jgi:glycosyltransferase involved in cell wall biosynthesis